LSQNYHPNTCFFRKGWIERRRIEVKKTGNIDDTFKFVCEVYFNPQDFFAIIWSVPLTFKKYILIPNFIFQSFFMRKKKEESLNSSEERETSSWWWFRPPNKLELVSMGYIRWGKFYSGCFKSQYNLKIKTRWRMQYFFQFDLVVWTFFGFHEFVC
jgi:hypothetical protein